MTYGKISVRDKRSALIDFVDNIVTNDFGEEFVIYEVPKSSFLQVGSRMDRREVQENSNGKVRHIDVFWDGPATPGTFPDIDIRGIFRSGSAQRGSVDAFRVIIHYGVEYDTNGAINNRKTFEDLLSGYDPDGLLPRMRSRDTLKSNGRTMLFSTPTSVSIPPSPSPMQTGGEEYAHYGEIRVFLTDM